MRRAARWLLRIAIAVIALVALAVAAVLVFLHTDYGREQVRARIDAQLATALAGGGQIGKLEGSPFGELVLHDVVINGPDHQPAIRIGTARLRIHVFELLSRHAQIDSLIAEDVELVAKRDGGGRLELGQLVQPDTSAPWQIDLANVEIRRGHVTIETGTSQLGVMHLDDVMLTGHLSVSRSHALDLGIRAQATWRDRDVPLAIAVAGHDDAAHSTIRSLAVQAGDANVSGDHLEIAKRAGALPIVGGRARIVAPRAAVAKLVPGVDTVRDLTLGLVATPTGGAVTAVTIDGMVGVTAIHASVAADADTRRAVGTATVGELELARWTNDAYVATVGGDLAFDVAPGAPGDFPTAHVTVRGHARDTAEATFEVELAARGHAVTVERASLVGSSRDPARVTNGRVPLHGRVDANVAAHGTLVPAIDLAVTGTIDGHAVHLRELAASTLHVAIDAAQLPGSPQGQARIEATEAVRGTTRLGDLDATVATRADGRIAIAARSNPRRGTWLAEVAAIVTPPGRGDTTTIELVRHRVHVDDGREWTGTGGRVVIDPRHVELQDLRSSSRDSALALAGSYTRSGDSAGDVVASLTATAIAIDQVEPGATGTVDVHAEVVRRRGLWRGSARATGRHVALRAGAEPLDGAIAIVAAPGSVLATADVSGPRLGAAKLVLDLAAPPDVLDLAAWRARGRSAIRRAELTAHTLDLHRLGVTGTLDGTLAMTPTTATGALHAHGLVVPGIGPVQADLALAQAASGAIAPIVTVRLAGIGTIAARGELAMPEHVFDPDAWRALGPAAIHGASITLRDVAIDRRLLARFGIDVDLRARASLDVQLAPALRSIQLIGDVSGLGGTPLSRSLAAHIEATIGDTAHATIAIRTDDRASITIARVEADSAMSLAQIRADPRGIRALPLAGTVTIAPIAAPVLVGLIGHSQITGGTVQGSVTFGGTVGQPTVDAHLLGEHLTVPPGPHGSIKAVDRIAIDATWNGRGGTLAIDGDEPAGGKLSVTARGNPRRWSAATAQVHATKFDLAALLAFAPGPASGSTGTLDADLAIAGLDPRTSKVTGELHLANARVPIAPTVGTMRDAKIDLAIREHDVKIAVAGKLGAGTAALDGSIALDGASLSGGVAKLTLRKVSLIGSIEPIIDADVSAKLSRAGARWTADLVVDNGAIKVATTRGEKLKPAGIPPDMLFTNGKGGPRPAATRRPPTRPILVVNITFRNTRVVSSETRTVIQGKLVLTTDGESIGVNGTVQAERGDLDLFDRRYQIETAIVSFDGTTDPLLDIRIVHEFPGVETITEVHGRLSKPKLDLSANPNGYTEGQLLGFLLGGEPGGDPTSAGARDKIGDAGASLVANQLSGYIKKALPFDLDVIRYEAAGVRSSSAITVGSWVTHTLFFAYRQHLAARPDENTGEGTLEYWITRRLQIEGVVGDRGYDGVDLLWRKRF